MMSNTNMRGDFRLSLLIFCALFFSFHINGKSTFPGDGPCLFGSQELTGATVSRELSVSRGRFYWPKDDCITDAALPLAIIHSGFLVRIGAWQTITPPYFFRMMCSAPPGRVQHVLSHTPV